MRIAGRVNHYHRGSPHPEQTWDGVVNTNSNWESRCEVYPVEGSLYIRKSHGNLTDHVGVRGDSISSAFNCAVQSSIWVREQIDVCWHVRLNMPKLCLAKIRNDPPCSCVDQRKYLLSRMSICSFRDCEVGHSGVERSVDPAVVQVVLGSFDSRSSPWALSREWGERSYAMLRLLDLLVALIKARPVLFILCKRGLQSCLRQFQLGASLLDRLPSCRLKSSGLIHLIDGHKLLGQ